MVEMLLGNWYTITRLLTSRVSEWYVLFGVSHQLIVGFAVIEVITGVFLHQTFKVANMDDGILLNETKREIKDQSQKMLRFFKHADVDGNGQLSKEEFREVLGRDKVQEWMSAMGLDVHQVEKVFHLFDVDRSGSISPEELISGTLQLKGHAKAMELALVRTMVEDIQRTLRRLNKASQGSQDHRMQDIDEIEDSTVSTFTPQISSAFSRQTSAESSAYLPGQAD
jgi:Ca2+-binding EF-hand superfamily protein